MAKKSIETTYTLSIIVVLLTFFPDTAIGQGLRFNGLDYHIDERTSYTVFGNRHPVFTDIDFSEKSEREGVGMDECGLAPDDGQGFHNAGCR